MNLSNSSKNNQSVDVYKSDYFSAFPGYNFFRESKEEFPTPKFEILEDGKYRYSIELELRPNQSYWAEILPIAGGITMFMGLSILIVNISQLSVGFLLYGISVLISGLLVIIIPRIIVRQSLAKPQLTQKVKIAKKEIFYVRGFHIRHHLRFDSIGGKFLVTRPVWNFLREGDQVTITYYPKLNAISHIELITTKERPTISYESAKQAERNGIFFTYLVKFLFVLSLLFMLLLRILVFIANQTA